ncbi:MAG: chemotaxis response regulator protein-glutamate methylesterase [Ectothiorhodospiraceae bacterium]|nr:chemotaxis response regulator protein-glutamate methylesterase [Ectothiorhodospiraceae bacterium]
MAVRVLVVDDSRFFRRRVTEMLESDPQIKVIDSAENGVEAVSKAARLKPDVITMDVEMPVMDGITATKKIMAASPTAILMFSSLTTDGAKATFDALDAGAVDFLPKRFEDISNDRDEARRVLCERVRAVGNKRVNAFSAARHPSPVARPGASRGTLRGTSPGTSPGTGDANKASSRTGSLARPGAKTLVKGKTKIVAIGTSTGGPVALQNVLKKLPANFPVPIILIQHMPGSFTTAFAERLNNTCSIKVREAKDGDALEPGTALLAPGGQQMFVEKRGAKSIVRITKSEPGQNYKPCVDITFTSVAKNYPGNSLAIILTGMGADGREGAKLIKQGGAPIWAQDEASCVVYGMPAAIVDAGLADQILTLDDVGKTLAASI